MSRYTILLSEGAASDLDRIEAWLAQFEAANPARTRIRIAAAFDRLARHDVGRPGRAEGTRELSVPDAPYVIIYRVVGETIEIIAVFHTGQNR